MIIGVNWTYPHTLPVIKQLIQHKLIGFCEISIDNFIHLPVEMISDTFQDFPVAIHILSSRFLERTQNELEYLARHIRHWIKELKPLYVSDHLAQFTDSYSQIFPLVKELDYDRHSDFIISRILQWQELIGDVLLLENFPSHDQPGKSQPEFFERMITATGANILFDFSNAYIADRNSICAFERWEPLIKKTNHYHVAGFQYLGSPSIAIDTHNAEIDDEVVKLIRKNSASSALKTLVIEFTAELTLEKYASYASELLAGIQPKLELKSDIL